MLEAGLCISDRYRLVRPIGEGGMGVVWAATHEVLGRDVAIKIMLPELAKAREAMQRFFNEARICASIRDPGIVDVLDFGYANDGAPFIVMELLEGESLEELLARERVLSIEILLPILRDVAATLGLAHERQIVHRDMKPSNVFLHRTARGQMVPKILDFGISKVLGGGSMRMTRTGAVVGTPAYMSPEQARGMPVDHRSDIYALGAILYEGLTGRLPFEEDTYNAMIVAIATKEPEPLRSLLPQAPAELVAIVERCMQRDAELRFQQTAELVARLDGLLGVPALQVPAPSLPTAVVATDPGLRNSPEGVVAATRISADVAATATAPVAAGPLPEARAAVVRTEVPLSGPVMVPSRSRFAAVAGAVAIAAVVATVVWLGGSDDDAPAVSGDEGAIEPAVAAVPTERSDEAEAPATAAPPALAAEATATAAPTATATATASIKTKTPVTAPSPAPPRPPVPPKPPPPPKPKGSAWDFD